MRSSALLPLSLSESAEDASEDLEPRELLEAREAAESADTLPRFLPAFLESRESRPCARGLRSQVQNNDRRFAMMQEKSHLEEFLDFEELRLLLARKRFESVEAHSYIRSQLFHCPVA